MNQQNRQSGQAMVEYILMIVVALSIVALIAMTFKRTLIRVWGYYTRQVSAACPGCPPNSSYILR